MRIYLAGKWEEKPLMVKYANALREKGHTITFPWFELHKDVGEDLVKSAVDDMQGVMDADLCLCVFERELPYSGALSEFGAAIALKKRVLIIGHGADKNIFTNHPYVEKFDHILDVLRAL